MDIQLPPTGYLMHQRTRQMTREKKRHEEDSTVILHKGQRIEEMSTPRKERLSLVGNLSKQALQPKILILMGTTLAHLVGTSAFGNNESSIKERADFTEQSPDDFKFQTQLSLL